MLCRPHLWHHACIVPCRILEDIRDGIIDLQQTALLAPVAVPAYWSATVGDYWLLSGSVRESCLLQRVSLLHDFLQPLNEGWISAFSLFLVKLDNLVQAGQMALLLLLERSSQLKQLRLDSFELGQVLVVQESADQVCCSIRDLLG